MLGRGIWFDSSRLYEKEHSAAWGLTPAPMAVESAMAINYADRGLTTGQVLVAGTERGLCSVTW